MGWRRLSPCRPSPPSSATTPGWSRRSSRGSCGRSPARRCCSPAPAGSSGAISSTCWRRSAARVEGRPATSSPSTTSGSGCRVARSILYLSSSEIYGGPSPEIMPTPEDYRGNVSCTGPRACYDESKRLAETLCTTYFRTHRTPVKIMRPFNVYGPGQRLDDQRIIPDLMAAALARRPSVLYSDGRATRSFCYVRDAIRAMLLVLVSDADGEAFNVGNDEETTMSALAELMATIAEPPRLAVG